MIDSSLTTDSVNQVTRLKQELEEARTDSSCDSLLFTIPADDVEVHGKAIMSYISESGCTSICRFKTDESNNTLEFLIMWENQVKQTKVLHNRVLHSKLLKIEEYVLDKLERDLDCGNIDPQEFAILVVDTRDVVFDIINLLEE